jgi:hypothetical protein
MMFLWGCSSQPAPETLSRQLNDDFCGIKSFQGIGISEDYNEALDIAISQIAVQINGSVQVKNTLDKRQEMVDGSERLSSRYKMRTSVQANLKNREDVHVVKKIWQGDSIGVVACMDRGDAAKPYRSELQKAKDDFFSASNVLREERHPQKKLQLVRDIKDAYTRYRDLMMVLESMGVGDDGSVEKEYKAFKEYLDQFKSSWKFFYAGSLENEVEKAIFSEIQKKFTLIVAESCSEGVLLSLSLSDMDCRDGYLGLTCSQQVSLVGSDCLGNKYFSLNGTLKGVGKDGEEDARKRLAVYVKKSDFMTSLYAELERWDVK